MPQKDRTERRCAQARRDRKRCMVSVALYEDLATLRGMALARGTSVSALVRTAVARWLAEEEDG